MRLRPEEVRFVEHVKQVYQHPITLIDVGANKGEYTRLFIEALPCRRVHLFEPIPGLYDRLPSDDICKRYNMALGAENTTAVFNRVVNGHGQSSLLDREHYKRANKIINKINVEVRKLQDVIPEEHVHVLKIDVEGYELEVLRGSSELLDSKRIDYIQFEYGGCFRDAGLKMNDIVNFLHGFNYGVFDLHETGFKRITNFQDDWRWCNYYAKKL